MAEELKPITPARLADEVRKLSAERRAGTIKADVYDQRFARMVGELRERRIDGNRAAVMAALAPLKASGDITDAELDHLLNRLGMK